MRERYRVAKKNKWREKELSTFFLSLLFPFSPHFSFFSIFFSLSLCLSLFCSSFLSRINKEGRERKRSCVTFSLVFFPFCPHFLLFLRFFSLSLFFSGLFFSLSSAQPHKKKKEESVRGCVYPFFSHSCFSFSVFLTFFFFFSRFFSSLCSCSPSISLSSSLP